jgi:hypothetical protein
MDEQTIGSTRDFVLGKGIIQIGRHSTLIGEDDTRRLFAELYADPDRPEVRPQEAYQAILSSMQPGWTLRLLQLFWPDPEPRLTFQGRVEKWGVPAEEGLDILFQGLSMSIQEQSLPYIRRTILEFVFPGDEGIAWWEGLSGLCQGFGIRVLFLSTEQIQELAHWMLNPRLDRWQTFRKTLENSEKTVVENLKM